MFKIKAHFSGGRETSVLSVFWLIHKIGLSRGTGEQGGPGGGQTLVPREKQAAELGTHQGSRCPGLPTLRCCQAMTLSVALILSGTQGGSF